MSTGPWVHADCPRISRPAKVVRSGGSSRARYPARSEARRSPPSRSENARRHDAGRAMTAGLRVGLDQSSERPTERGLHEQLADFRNAPARVEDRGSAGRVDVELAPRLRNGEETVHVLIHRESVLGVVDRRGEDLADALRPVRLEQGQVRVDGAGHRERQMSVGARPGRDAIELALTEEPDGRQRRRRPLTAQRQSLPCPGVVNERHALATERVRRGRLHDSGGEARGHHGVERVAAREQHAHARHRHERMASGDDALRARDHGSRRRSVGCVVLCLVDSSGRLAHRLTSLCSLNLMIYAHRALTAADR